MDPIAHSLVGACLSETRLKRLTRLATPTLVLAANAPDIDIVSTALGRDFSLGFRRGWTHGVLAMAILPLVLAGLIVLTDRVVAALRQQPPKAQVGPLIVLSYLGVLTHPLLDWLNTYGIRLLMPFDDRWFYGDALFIIDPWVWLLVGTVVVLAHTQSAASRTAWLVLGLAVTALVTGFAGVPTTARWFWVAGFVAIIALRIWGGTQHRLPRLATVGLICATLYIAAMVAGSRLASRQASDWLAQRGNIGSVVMAGPLPANPFVRDIVVVDESHYHFLELNWLDSDRIQIVGPPVPRGPDGPVVEAARTATHIQGLLTWIRFPAYSVQPLPDGFRVMIRDARYSRLEGLGLGTVSVDLDRDLQVRPPD